MRTRAAGSAGSPARSPRLPAAGRRALCVVTSGRHGWKPSRVGRRKTSRPTSATSSATCRSRSWCSAPTVLASRSSVRALSFFGESKRSIRSSSGNRFALTERQRRIVLRARSMSPRRAPTARRDARRSPERAGRAPPCPRRAPRCSRRTDGPRRGTRADPRRSRAAAPSGSPLLGQDRWRASCVRSAPGGASAHRVNARGTQTLVEQAPKQVLHVGRGDVRHPPIGDRIGHQVDSAV